MPNNFVTDARIEALEYSKSSLEKNIEYHRSEIKYHPEWKPTLEKFISEDERRLLIVSEHIAGLRAIKQCPYN